MVLDSERLGRLERYLVKQEFLLISCRCFSSLLLVSLVLLCLERLERLDRYPVCSSVKQEFLLCLLSCSHFSSLLLVPLMVLCLERLGKLGRLERCLVKQEFLLISCRHFS